MARFVPMGGHAAGTRWKERRPFPVAALLLVGGATALLLVNLATVVSLGSTRGCPRGPRADGEIDVVLAVAAIAAYAIPAAATLVVAKSRRNAIVTGALGAITLALQLAMLILLPYFRPC